MFVLVSQCLPVSLTAEPIWFSLYSEDSKRGAQQCCGRASFPFPREIAPNFFYFYFSKPKLNWKAKLPRPAPVPRVQLEASWGKATNQLRIQKCLPKFIMNHKHGKVVVLSVSKAPQGFVGEGFMDDTTEAFTINGKASHNCYILVVS